MVRPVFSSTTPKLLTVEMSWLKGGGGRGVRGYDVDVVGIVLCVDSPLFDELARQEIVRGGMFVGFEVEGHLLHLLLEDLFLHH